MLTILILLLTCNELTPLQLDKTITNITLEFAHTLKRSCAIFRETDYKNENQHVRDIAKSLSRNLSCQTRPLVTFEEYITIHKSRSCIKSLHVVYGLDLKIKSSLKKVYYKLLLYFFLLFFMWKDLLKCIWFACDACKNILDATLFSIKTFLKWRMKMKNSS